MFCLVSFLIMCVGGINWLCIGLFQFDLIAGIFGSQASFVSRFLYMIIGLATLCSLIALPIQKGRVYTPQNLPKHSTKDTQKPKKAQKDTSKSSSNSHDQNKQKEKAS